MEPTISRPWYKKKRYAIPLGVVALIALGAGTGSSPSTSSLIDQQASLQQAAVGAAFESQTSAVPEAQTTATPAPTKVVAPVKTAPPAANLSNNNYYTNSAGNEVHSPAYSDSVPAGASAQCRDGTYSFSQSRRGTCSRHGGVAEWF